MNIRSILFFLCAFFCSAAIMPRTASAQQPENQGGLLWKISGNGLKEPSYLMGTFHGACYIQYNFTDSIPGFKRALKDTRQLVVEGDMTNPLKTIGLLIKSRKFLFLPSGTSYDLLLSARQNEMLDSVLVKYLDLKVKKIFRPIILSVIIEDAKSKDKLRQRGMNEKEIRKISKEVIDSELIKEAKRRGHKIVELETMSEALNALTSLSLEQEAQMLIMGIDNSEYAIRGEKLLIQLIQAYRDQNLESIRIIENEDTRYLEKMPPYMAELKKRISLERNYKWMEKIPSIIGKRPSLIAVGVGHLQGEEGLIDLLRAKGYELEPVLE